MTLCFLGLGSNLRSPKRQLRQAIRLLYQLPRSVITRISSLYFSQPCGIRAQPPFCNMVVAIHTALPPEQLLKYCQGIEHKLHRIRKKRFGARTVDIDLLLYGDKVIHNHLLIVPHPHMLKRDFVLVPLLEISPSIQLPGGEPIAAYLKGCETYLFKLQ